MKEFTPEEIESIVKAMGQTPPTDLETPLSLRPSFSRVSFTAFPPSPIQRSHQPLTDKEWGAWKSLKVKIEVSFGTTTLSLEDLNNLKPGSIVALDQLASEPVDIYANGSKIGKGEIVASNGKYALRILSFEEKKKML